MRGNERSANSPMFGVPAATIPMRGNEEDGKDARAIAAEGLRSP